MHFLYALLAQSDGSEAITSAWVAATASVVTAVAGGVFAYLIHRSNKRFIAEETNRTQQHEQTYQTMLKRLDRFFSVQDAAVENARRQVSSLAHYAPLVNASITALKYRLHEIVKTSGEIQYFHDDQPASDFIRYKHVSTLHRFAVLFAWLRAFKLEQSLLNPLVVKNLQPQIEAVEKAFSDGHFVDKSRLEALAGPNLGTNEARATASRRLSALLQEFLARRSDVPRHQLEQLEDEEQEEICRRATEILNEELGAALTTPEGGERSRMLRRIGIREAWLYRDWQDALGGMMLVETENSPRRYNVIGYGDFEALYEHTFGSGAAQGGPPGFGHAERAAIFLRWLPRLKSVFDQLDMSKKKVDARVIQLKNVSTAVDALAGALQKVVEELAKESKNPNGNKLDS